MGYWRPVEMACGAGNMPTPNNVADAPAVLLINIYYGQNRATIFKYDVHACMNRRGPRVVQMRIRGFAVLALTVLMLGLVFYPQGAAQKTPAPDADEATAIKMHFKSEGLTTVDPAAGNSTEETKPCPGRNWGGRIYGTIIGEWGFVPAGPVKVAGSLKAELWAKSDAGAKNAGFRLNINSGGNSWAFFSDRTTLSTPHKYTIADSMSGTLAAGSTVSAQLVWLSDPNYGAGPSGGGTFMYGSKDHDSMVQFTLSASPVSMNVTSVDKEGGNLKVNARVNESLGMPVDSLTYTLTIQGPATVAADHIAKPIVSAGDNGTSVSWLWSYKRSRAQSGLYTFTVIVAYCNDTSFSNATQVMIRIDTQSQGSSPLALGGGSALPLTIVVIVIVAVICGVVGFFVWRKLRLKKARLLAAAELEPVVTA